jgi:hypothetical protein
MTMLRVEAQKEKVSFLSTLKMTRWSVACICILLAGCASACYWTKSLRDTMQEPYLIRLCIHSTALWERVSSMAASLCQPKRSRWLTYQFKWSFQPAASRIPKVRSSFKIGAIQLRRLRKRSCYADVPDLDVFRTRISTAAAP